MGEVRALHFARQVLYRLSHSSTPPIYYWTHPARHLFNLSY
jgi:hypothetical protein